MTFKERLERIAAEARGRRVESRTQSVDVATRARVGELAHTGPTKPSRWQEWKRKRAEEGAYKREVKKQSQVAFKEAYREERIKAIPEAAREQARAAAKTQAQQEAQRYMPRPQRGILGGGERIAGQVGRTAAGVSRGIGDLFGWNQPQQRPTGRAMPWGPPMSVFGEPSQQQRARGPGLSGGPGLPGLFKGSPSKPPNQPMDLFSSLEQLTAPLRQKGPMPQQMKPQSQDIIVKQGGRTIARIKRPQPQQQG
jgi:hypothetical protein